VDQLAIVINLLTMIFLEVAGIVVNAGITTFQAEKIAIDARKLDRAMM